ncbi:MAG: ABC transporter substrate-binding protein [Egibacteraceae bacterium]
MSTSSRPRTPWWYPTGRKLTALFLVLALIGGVSWWVWSTTYCASGIRRLGPECVGVTDGGFVFTPDLASALEQIQDENRWVAQQVDRPSVSIAYLVPLPREADNLSEILRHELQGASIAQHRANRTNELGDLPLIRLLVANTGEGGNHWQPVVAQLLDRVGSSDRLVAVAGLGESRETTRQAIAELSAHEIPMIAARPAADDLGGEGFVRMAPISRDQAAVAIAYLKQLDPPVSRALLIQDVNPEDPYTRTLGDAFIRGFPDATHALIEPVERYDGSLGGLANRFVQMMANICQQRPDVVYFAGRGNHLEAFIEALPGRPCPDLRVNLMTGGTGARAAIVLRQQIERGQTPLQAGLGANVTFRYTTQAHPGAWAVAPASFSQASIRYFQQNCPDPACFASLYRGESLDDSGAVIGHDAVVTAVRAIRSAAGDRDLVTDPITTDEVIQQFNGLHDSFAVPGASGWISLDGDGNPVNKAIPILQLLPDGTVMFVQLSSLLPPPFTPLNPQDPGT